MSPNSTSSSTSTTVVFAAIAINGEKVASRLFEPEIAVGIALLGLDNCKVSFQRKLQAGRGGRTYATFFSFGDDSAVACWSVKTADAHAGGADALGKGSLRREVHFNLSGEHLFF